MLQMRFRIARIAAAFSFLVVLIVLLFLNHQQEKKRVVQVSSAVPEATQEAQNNPTSLLAGVAAATTTPKKPVASTTATSTAPPSQKLALALGSLRDALVNIVCVSKDASVRSISGSGVIISPSGLILTDAHIAQLFLLQDYPRKGNVTCVVRSGSPAKSEYTARLAYISQKWLTANPATLTQTQPKGTGQHDVALLSITDMLVAKDLLPKSFPYVPLSEEDTRPKESIAIGAYPAQTLSSAQIRSSLYPTLVFASIQKLYTFTKDTIDLLDLGGSAVAQEGSSGGGVVNEQGELVGLITTSTVSGELLSRDLHAITLSHVRETFAEDMGTSLDDALRTQTPAEMAESFKTRASELSAFLEEHLTAGN